jgi:uncharacterized protein (DUF1501 family)
MRASSANRAVVCIYLMGGNDSNNMIVPLDSPAYDAYTRGRGALALSKDVLLPAQNGSSRYGFHPNLPGLRDLYNRNTLAVVANVGRMTPGHRIAGDPSDFAREMQLRYLPSGYLGIPWALPSTSPAGAQPALSLAHGVTLSAPDAHPVRHRNLVSAIAADTSNNRLPATQLGRKLGVALSALKLGGFTRQALVVPFSGFEANTDQLNRQAALFAELDAGLMAFQDALSQLGMAESVTIYTDTEFNRSLRPNQSGGTDHAWGGHQFVLGLSTIGGQIYGKFPSLEVGGADDVAGNGTWAPSTSSTQYAATLAYWYGKTDLSDVPEYANSGAIINRLGFLTN